MALADLLVNLRLNTAEFATKLATTSKSVSAFASKMHKSYGTANKEIENFNKGVKTSGDRLRDVSRIVQGIVISQTFYTATRSIREASRSLWEFNKALDYANVTYTALFGDATLSNDFMNVLQQHAIETMFDYQDLADASKKLLAYGIEYENLMFIMEGLTNLGAMSGDSAALDRISLALGQIYTRGKLTAEEMRQLANAYVPISDIIQEKFQLTPEQMGKVGDLNLPAEEVINAVVDYANERFGSVGDAAMFTITGIQAKIVDTIKVVGTEMLATTTTAYKSFLVFLSDGLNNIREAYNTGGAGGVFEYLVPNKETQTIIRQFIANVKNLFMSLVSVGVVLGQVFGNFGYVLITAFNITLPVLTTFMNVISSVMYALLNTSVGAKTLRVALVAAAGAFLVLTVRAAAAMIITAVSKAVTGLTKALFILASVVGRHPILMLMAGLAVALVGVSVASSNANKSISSLFDTLSGAGGGYSQDDILQRVEKDMQNSADAADQFNNRLGDSANAAEELEDGINGAGKAAKKAAAGLLSFDEVFKLNEQAGSGSDSGAGGGIADGIEGLISGLGTLGDALIPDIPDFSDYVSDFTDGLFGGLENGLIERLRNSAIGAIIGGGIGAIIGGLLGGPAGAVLGAKIGAFAGGLIGLFKDEIIAFFRTDTGVGAALGAGIGAIFGGLLGGPMGAGIGAGIGALVGGIVGKFGEEITKFFQSDTGLGVTLGASIGTMFGMLLGGPTGGLIGAGVGALLGGLFGMFKDELLNFFSDVNDGLKTWYNETTEDMQIWVLLTAAKIKQWWDDTKNGFKAWRDETIEDIQVWILLSAAKIKTWATDTRTAISDWWKGIKTGFSEWKADLVDKVTTGLSDAKERISTWTYETKQKYSTWWTENTAGFRTWVSDSVNRITTWRNDTRASIFAWADESRQKLSTWWSDIKTGFSTWKAEAGKYIATWASDAYTNVKTKFDQVTTKINDFFNLKTNFSDFCRNTLKSITDWANDIWNSIKDKFGKAIDKVKEFLRVDDEGSSKSGSLSSRYNTSPLSTSYIGHATGGIFNREHLARFAEGNKTEAIIPLENDSAMQPFVDAVANGLVGALAPILAQVGPASTNQLPPMYVGTLVADDRGLKQLYKKFELIQAQENARRGTV